ncbi:hypothetical protein RF11_15168 [Thelohanellus kitauei]|uniref:Uncharacterized protein n=1 Tax=Thelohanellus kitauei TaxID=669202 RepID=A0A0C2N8M8_THEKT|nr:hypothetical protein RF11_15168 [Thelohanellus kitauei]
MGTCRLRISTCSNEKIKDISFNVIRTKNLNILSLSLIKKYSISLDSLIDNEAECSRVLKIENPRSDEVLVKKCMDCCADYLELWKKELGTLKNYEIEVAFMADATPKFCKPRTIPFALRESVDKSLEAGIRSGVWETTQFNQWGTPIVAIRKP